MSLDLPIWCKNCWTPYRIEGSVCPTCTWCEACGCDPALAMARCAVCGAPTCDEMLDVDYTECAKCVNDRRAHDKAYADCELEHKLEPHDD